MILQYPEHVCYINDLATGWMVWFLISGQQGHEIFLLSNICRLDLRPTQPPIPQALAILPSECEVDHSSVCITKFKWSYTSIPIICLHDMPRNSLFDFTDCLY